MKEYKRISAPLYFWRLFRLVRLLIVAAIMTLAVHEMFHAIGAHWLGGDAVVSFKYVPSWLPLPTAGFARWTDLSGNSHLWIAYLAGGFGVAICWAFFWWEAWLTKTRDGMYLESVSAGMFLFSVFYAPVELFLFWGLKAEVFDWLYIVANIVGGLVFTLLYAHGSMLWLINVRNRWQQAG